LILKENLKQYSALLPCLDNDELWSYKESSHFWSMHEVVTGRFKVFNFPLM
jgi:hypothetical protein